MNFLIISLARCGSSSLQKSIASKYKINKIFEPYAFDPHAINFKNDYKINNVVVKTLFHQIDNQHHTMNCNEVHLNKCVDFYLNLIPKFDKVILLNRSDLTKQAESLSMLYGGNLFDSGYVYKSNKNINRFVEVLEIENIFLKKLAKELNIKIDSYENLYYGDGLIDKSIELDYDLLNTELKLRKEIKKSKKIL